MAAAPPDAKWVALHFVQKFYDVLQHHPQFLSKFYKDGSSATVTLMDEHVPTQPSMDLDTIQAVVNATVAGAKTTTKHMDAQFSINGGVLLHVVGTMELKGQERSFEQTFFLATQENGFYVHNDLLRLYPALLPQAATANGNYAKAPPAAVPVAAPAPAAAPPPAPAPLPAYPPAQVVVPTVIAPAAPPAVVPAAPPPPAAAAAAPAPTSAAKAPRPQQPPASPSPSPAPASAPSPQPPSSWASLVKQQADGGKAAPLTPQKAGAAAPAAPEYGTSNGTYQPQPPTSAPAQDQQQQQPPQPLPTQPAYPQQQQQPPSSSSSQQQPPQQQQPQHHPHPHHHGPQHVVQVRNLPQQHLETSLLEAEFSRFGPLLKRPGHSNNPSTSSSVVIHNMGREQGKVAYVKFEDASGVEAALQATSIMILDRQVEVRKHEGLLPSYHRGAPGGPQGGPPYPRGPRGGSGGATRGPYSGGEGGSGGGGGRGGPGSGPKDRPPRRPSSNTPPPPGTHGTAPGNGGGGGGGQGSRPQGGGAGSQGPGGRGGRGGSGNGAPSGPRREEGAPAVAVAAAKE